MANAHVLALHTAPRKGAPMVAHEQVDALAGLGLAGDRYAVAAGTYSGQRVPDAQRAVTLIEQESLDLLREEHGITLTGIQTRRNVVTRGIALNDLVGRRFRVGGVELLGVDLAHPCAYLEELVDTPGLLRGLARRGGLRAEVLTSGPIAVGDEIDVTTPG